MNNIYAIGYFEILGSEDETKVVKKGKKRDSANPLIQRSKNRGRAKEEEHSSSEDSEDDLR